MMDLPRGARLYILIVFGLGLLTAFASAAAIISDLSFILSTLAIASLVAIFDLFVVSVRPQHSDMLLSSAIKVAAVILTPPPVLLLAIFIGTIVSEWWLKRVWYKMIFNAGTLTITYLFVTLVYQVLHQPGPGILDSFQNVAAVLMLGVTDITVNSTLVSLILALTGKMPIRTVIAENYRPVMWHEMTMLPIGVFIAMLWHVTAWSVVLAVPPLILARQAYKIVTDLEWQTREALQALARVLDERDEQTSMHSEHVSEYARMIATAMALNVGEIDVITRAAWLHDIGKVGMRNDILYKPGSLSYQERELAQRHAAIGGDLLKKFPLFEKGADYVRHHHEWWNGKGYPDGLVGDAIPLGARILAVADAYQAMTDERPYRKPLAVRVALEELKRGAGEQFDPEVVEAFFRAKGLTGVWQEPEIDTMAFDPQPVSALASSNPAE